MRVNSKVFNGVLKEADKKSGMHVFESIGFLLGTDNESKIAHDIVNNGFTVTYNEHGLFHTVWSCVKI